MRKRAYKIPKPITRTDDSGIPPTMTSQVEAARSNAEYHVRRRRCHSIAKKSIEMVTSTLTSGMS
jgi:hypothetical protein